MTWKHLVPTLCASAATHYRCHKPQFHVNWTIFAVHLFVSLCVPLHFAAPVNWAKWPSSSLFSCSLFIVRHFLSLYCFDHMYNLAALKFAHVIFNSCPFASVSHMQAFSHCQRRANCLSNARVLNTNTLISLRERMHHAEPDKWSQTQSAIIYKFVHLGDMHFDKQWIHLILGMHSFPVCIEESSNQWKISGKSVGELVATQNQSHANQSATQQSAFGIAMCYTITFIVGAELDIHSDSSREKSTPDGTQIFKYELHGWFAYFVSDSTGCNAMARFAKECQSSDGIPCSFESDVVNSRW